MVLVHNVTTTLQNVQASVHVDRWFEESKAFISDAPYPTTAMLRLLNYPGWVAQVDGLRVPIASDNRTGQAMIALPAGKHQVEVRFGPTPDRSFGSIISLAASVVLLVLLVLSSAGYQRPAAGVGGPRLGARQWQRGKDQGL